MINFRYEKQMVEYRGIIADNNEVAQELKGLVKLLLRTKERREYVMQFVDAVFTEEDKASIEIIAIQERNLEIAREQFKATLREQADEFLAKQNEEEPKC